MIPKVCYLLFYFFLSLVVASPVALQVRDDTPKQLVIKQTIKSGTSKDWTVFGSYLTFDKDAKIEPGHLVGIVKKAYDQMVSTANTVESKKNLPNVMTAIQVGNEIFLSSNMKGGGGHYIYNMQEQPLPNKGQAEDVVEDGYGAFAEVLQNNAPDVKAALDDLRRKSRELDHKNPQPNSQNPSGTKGSHGKGSHTNSQHSSRKGFSKTDPNEASQELKHNRQTTFQHKNDANCGEVMASIRYRNVHKGQTEQLRKKNPKPVVVAWSVMPGKPGTIREPCEKGRTLDGEGACGLSWGCGAFVGPQGMDFDVVDRKTKAIEVDANFPKFTVHEAELPKPTIKQQTTKPDQSSSNRNNNKNNKNNNNGQSGSTSKPPATKPKDDTPKKPPTQPPAKKPDTKNDPKKKKKGGK
ncbi:uncharacterized protein KD926_005697 [Aspergillus affinis]|uniref:uncharacterized protein n=1 Tax=Aspergillus affinis TaxID=1070780 RepID=UPI0022FF1C3E|nr:uncharacterized protein KD926_005697 [Aspergillus affinis]KAI9034760.1 hypothetical protein KD926_005697 [Aspergillus affinis]